MINKEENKENFKHGELRELVLRCLGIGLLVGGSILFPNLPIVVASIISLIEKEKGFKISKIKVKRVLKNLEKKRIINLEQKGNEALVWIKDKNNISIIKYSLKELFDFKKKNKIWKGKWFLVIFDVPEDEKNKREYLRKFLLDLGFFPYQKSVYIFPYECDKEIDLIKKIVEGGKYIKYITADKIEEESVIKTYFKI